MTGHTLFATPIGTCGIAWSDDSIVATQLPEKTPAATRRRLRRISGDATTQTDSPPPLASEAIERIRAVTGGARDDLRDLPIDNTDVSPFVATVREVTRSIPVGDTMTYGGIARSAGRPTGAQAVGAVMGSNRLPLIVPCHRVVAASGRIGGFSAAAGVDLKLRLLHTERLAANSNPPPFDTAAAAAHLANVDPELASIIDAVGPAQLRTRTTTTLFADLVEAVLHQQISTTVGAILHARLCAAMPRPLEGPTPVGVLRLSDDDLAEIGLSASKTKTLRALTDAAYNGQLPSDDELHHLDDDQIIDALTHIWGIGRWTAQTMLIFRLWRPDVYCDGDQALRTIIDRTYASSLEQPGTTHGTIAERWKPYRSLACWYLWQSVSIEDR